MLRRACFASAVMIFLLGCGSDPATNGSGGNGGAGGGTGTGGDRASFQVRGSVEQIHVWKAPPDTTIEVRDAQGAVVQSGKSDALGSLVFRKIPPGDGYSVTALAAAPPNTIAPVRVMTIEDSKPAVDFYAGQKLEPGFNYITTRDGTKLSAYVTLPGPPEEGPYPTVVNYSGYAPSSPGAPIPGYEFLCADLPVFCDAPSDTSALVASLMGYATVGVNIRGTGCSGGAYQFFEDLQLLDGYDVIETVAAQPWVLGHRVGMTGLSYPGISQLFVARTHPPSLAAITPLSVIGGTHTTGRPGGMFNDGFALQWITSVLDKAKPYGQGWEQTRVDAGDTVCEENQLLHGQRIDDVQRLRETLYYTDEVAGAIDPTAFAHEIDVPVFLGGAFQDEQTGPYFFTLLDRFTAAPIKRFTVYNGVHPDGFAPQVLIEWKAFLDIYVAHQVPSIDPAVRQIAPALFTNFFQAPIPMPPDRFTQYATWEDARAAYEAEPALRVIFENGGSQTPGAPVGTFDLFFDAWPPPATTPLRLYFHADGSMDETPPVEADAASSWKLDPEAGQRGILPNGGEWDPLPAYDWKPLPDGYDVVFESAPLTGDVVMLGSGSVDLWLRSPVDDADLEVNLTEVRPDGQERYIQSGWLRASLRALKPTSTDLWPDPTYRQADEALLVPGEWTPVRVGIAGFSHVFRAGSRIRVTVDTPGDSRVSWRFDLKKFPGEVIYDVAHSSAHPSSLVLPVIPGQTVTTPLPACPSLRAQQCRAYVPYTNTPAAP